MDSDVARIVARLDEQAATISDVLCTAAQEGVPELPRDDEMSALMRAAMSDQLHTIFRALLRDIDVTRIAVPATHTEYARVLARRGIPIKAMMRAHRLGQRRLGAVVFAELQAAGMAPETQVTVVESLARTLSKYVDVLSQQALAAYQGEHGLMLTAQRIQGEVQIRDVLDDVKSFDVDAVSMAIGYPLSWSTLRSSCGTQVGILHPSASAACRSSFARWPWPPTLTQVHSWSVPTGLHGGCGCPTAQCPVKPSRASANSSAYERMPPTLRSGRWVAASKDSAVPIARRSARAPPRRRAPARRVRWSRQPMPASFRRHCFMSMSM